MKKALIFILLMSVGAVAHAKEKTKWNEHRSTHFVIYYKNAPLDFVESVEEMAERYYREITENLGFTRFKSWSFDRRAKISIFDDQQDYVDNANQAGWSHGAASARKKEIWTFPAAHGFFDTTLPHELGHIIFREFVGFRSDIPQWMDEGVAMYQETAKRWGSNQIVKKAIQQGTFIPLTDLTFMRLYRNTPKETVDLYYAEAASVVYFLITEHGKHRFVRFCRRLKKGESFKQAMSSVYFRFKSLDDLNKAWLRYLEQ